MRTNKPPIDIHAGLIYAMVMVSASDRAMTDAELATIGDLVTHLPIFAGFKPADLTAVARECARLLDNDQGMQRAFEAIRVGLPPRLHETAYALACDVASADDKATIEEHRLLELLRRELKLDALTAAALQRASRARYARA